MKGILSADAYTCQHAAVCSHSVIHKSGLENDGDNIFGEGTRGTGVCCCTEIFPTPRDRPGCSNMTRLPAEPWGRGKRPGQARAGPGRGGLQAGGLSGAARRPAATGGLHFPSKGTRQGAASRESGLLALTAAWLFSSRLRAFAVRSGFIHLKGSWPPCLLWRLQVCRPSQSCG